VVRDVGGKLSVPTEVIELKTSQEIQTRAPSPVGVYALIFEGEVILHHPVTEKDLLKLMQARGA
jgi:hypothetical protein